MQSPLVVLTIGGSDPSGGSGVQADLRTLAAMRIYGASVVTAITVGNTRAMGDVFAVPANVVSAQLTAVLGDLPVAAVKTGMFPNAEAAVAVAVRARAGALPNLVVDPVQLSATGSRLAVSTAIERLLPYALVATPDRDEASALVGWQVGTPDDMAVAARQIAAGGPRYVVVTGGDFVVGGTTLDVLWADGAAHVLRSPRGTGRNTLGSGATFATAIAGRLATGESAPDAVVYAKNFVARAIGDAAEWRIGNGNGPVDHFGWSSLSVR